MDPTYEELRRVAVRLRELKPLSKAEARHLEAQMTEEAAERACDDDRAWFASNPGAQVRQRDLVPGELPLPELPGGLEEMLPPEAFQVEVRQLAPGARTRQIVFVVLPAGVLPPGEAGE